MSSNFNIMLVYNHFGRNPLPLLKKNPYFTTLHSDQNKQKLANRLHSRNWLFFFPFKLS